MAPACSPEKRTALASAVWIIVDCDRHVATGCLKDHAGEAEQRLAVYIADKYRPSRHARGIDQIDFADVLSVYLEDCGPRMADQPKLERAIGRLNNYWGGKMLSEVTAAECRAYARSRGKTGGTRTDLETLRAAINHHAKENHHHGTVRVTLPPKGPPRDRWLTRDEAARLVWACWRYREQQTVHRGRQKGQPVETDKRPLRHLARFILIGLYTGTRASAIASASPYRDTGHSFVDLDQGIYYRLAIGRRATNKRQSPAPIPPRLLTHMRRWVRRGIITSHFVEWHGSPVKSVKTGFRHAVAVAGHPAAHCCDVAYAARRAHLAGGRVPRDVRRNDRAYLRPSPSGLHARRRAGDHVETIAERFFGCFIG